MGTKMNTIDDGYYFAPYLPIGVVPTIGNIGEKCTDKYVDKDVDNTYYMHFNCGYNEK